MGTSVAHHRRTVFPVMDVMLLLLLLLLLGGSRKPDWEPGGKLKALNDME